MTNTPVYESIERYRKEFGNRLTIVGHHYQTEKVIRHTDLRGDSLELARKTANVDSDHIVFCGVFFMAESAALLARPGQKVHLPELTADCSMAQMATGADLEGVMAALTQKGRKVIPLAYVNSTLEVKAIVGKYGGAVCTSANARVMLEWAMKEGDAVLFLPDQNLGLNTADVLGISPLDRYVIDSSNAGKNLNLAMADRARLLLWPGYCSIHTVFTTDRIAQMRSRHPGATVIVHPECTPEVVKAADASGSTSFIIRYVEEAPAGSTILIGTEVNLVWRLAAQHAGRVTVLPLKESLCLYMAQTTEASLEATLAAIAKGSNAQEITAPEALREHAKASLDRMFAVCG